MKYIGLVAFTLFLSIILWGGLFSNTASSQLVESRLNSLEADFRSLESRLNQIESHLGQNGSVPSPRTTLPLPQSQRSGRNVLPSDRMFDRLATLVIETRQDVNKLQARVAKLEKQR
ncbi:MAG: hypothetical protein DSM106950_13285 [Stigonema ocellatum SAG 48.90 = DSM 106950]|nr:hypothetical protein [Stigonema ocellatum SAG 48.90 = DSM 106950]